MSDASKHQPVLLSEVIAGLDLKPGQAVLDGTVGGGGHALFLAQAVNPGGHLIGLDVDSHALSRTQSVIQSSQFEIKTDLVQSNFRSANQVLDSLHVESVDGILLDLGFSSDQLTAGRGLSFLAEADPLLMTLGDDGAANGLTAYEIVNGWNEADLADIFYHYGEERRSRQLAGAIVAYRRGHKIETVGDLLEALSPKAKASGRLHFATKVFQALRIAVNDELGALKEVIDNLWPYLSRGGRMGIISFQGLEAKLVKTKFRTLVDSGSGHLVNKRAIKPTRDEVFKNPRARSAQLRLIEKI